VKDVMRLEAQTANDAARRITLSFGAHWFCGREKVVWPAAGKAE
jgi:hypothetical protein